MMHVTILRDPFLPDVTLGRMFIDGMDQQSAWLYTLEEPWKDNQPDISCVLDGTYDCIPHGWDNDPHLHQKQCWELTNVPNRKGILIHSGNTVNDIRGCVLVGTVRDHLNQLPAVLHSKDAMHILRGIIGQNGFKLTINNHKGE